MVTIITALTTAKDARETGKGVCMCANSQNGIENSIKPVEILSQEFMNFNDTKLLNSYLLL